MSATKRAEYMRMLESMVRREGSDFMRWVLRQVRLARSVRDLREELAMLRGGTDAWCESCDMPVSPFKPGTREGKCNCGTSVVFSTDWEARALDAEAKIQAAEAERAGEC